MKKIVSYLVMLIGISIILFPFLREQYENYKQEQILNEWEEDVANISWSSEGVDGEVEIDLLADLQIVNDFFNSAPDEEELEETSPQPEQKKNTVAIESIGIIKIEKINLKLPILAGASQENLKYGAAHMTATSPLGEIGNAAVAAHRAKTYGRLFNRLDELQVGDVITITKGKEVFQYTVYDKLRVKPDDVSVLKRNNRDKVITLITCDPVKNPTHRLIIHAKM